MNFTDLLFIDIETVGRVGDFDQLDERWQQLWVKKAGNIGARYNEMEPQQSFRERAAIYAEFGKAVCISCGFIYEDKGVYKIRLTSFAYEDEEVLLNRFSTFIDRHYHDVKKRGICGHNIKEFDIPYLCRRMMILGVPLPKAFQLHGKKPWEIGHLVDTLELWKFGDFKNFTSLDLLSASLGIPTPKDDIDGSLVHSTYYDERDLDRIAHYCEKDVITTMKVYMRLMQAQDDVDFDNIHHEDEKRIELDS